MATNSSTRVWVTDPNVLFFPIEEFFNEKATNRVEVAKRLLIPQATFDNWAANGFLPIKVYKAMCATFGDPKRMDESQFIVEKVEKAPLRITSPAIEGLTRRWEMDHEDHRFHYRRLANIPRRTGPLTYARTPEGNLSYKKGEVQPTTAAMPVTTHTGRLKAGDTSNVPKSGPVTAHTPVEVAPTVPAPVDVPAALADSDHAGMVQLARLCSELRVQRDEARKQRDERDDELDRLAKVIKELIEEKQRLEESASETRTHLTQRDQMVVELNETITTMQARINELEGMVDDLTKPVPAPVKAALPSIPPAKRKAEQEAAAIKAIKEVDDSLLKELEGLNRP